MGLSALSIERSAQLLVDAYRCGTLLAGLPAEYRPHSLDDGYAIQSLLAAYLGYREVGWKLGLTDMAAQRARGVSHPVCARLFDTRLYEGPVTLPGSPGTQLLEAEYVFRLGMDLPPRDRPWRRQEVVDAVSEMRLGIELCTSRFEPTSSPGLALSLADNSFHGALVLGPAIDDWESLDLAAIDVRLRCDDFEVAAGNGSHVMGHPIDALVWLANHLRLRGKTIRQGEWVTTGSCTGATKVMAPVRAVAQFAGLGGVAMNLDTTGVWSRGDVAADAAFEGEAA